MKITTLKKNPVQNLKSKKPFQEKLIIQFLLASTLLAIGDFKVVPLLVLSQSIPHDFVKTKSIQIVSTTATYEDAEHPNIKINTTSNDLPNKNLTTNDNDLLSIIDDLLEVELLEIDSDFYDFMKIDL